MKSFHHHKPLTYLLLLPFLFLLSSTPTTAQEACVRSCTQNSGINQCRGDIPHDQAAWDVLTAPVHDCYCLSAVKFSGCRPNCTLDGVPENIVQRIMGVWEWVNPVCKEAVEGISKVAESKSASTGSPEFTAILSEAFHTDVSSSSSTTIITTADAATVTVGAEPTGNANGTTTTGSSYITPPPTAIPSSPPAPTGTTDRESQTRTIAISVSLSATFFLAIGFVFWTWARRKRHLLSDQESPDAIGGGGMPGDNQVIVEDPKVQGIKRWVAEQERIKQLGIKMDPDTASETTSTAYTLWTDTELAPTEAGDRERELPPISEEDGESLAPRVTARGGV